MPISLPPLSRRQFLRVSAAGAAGTWLGRAGRAEEPSTDLNRFALLADTHVAGDRTTVARQTNMYDNLQQTCAQVQALPRPPVAVLIAGDCAYQSGAAEDYATLMELVRPVREAGLPVHLTLGNHDHRQRFWEAADPADRQAGPVAQRHVLRLAAPHANWFLLDSLDVTNKTPGVLGEPQLAWLAASLDAAADKPALVMVHHNPDSRPQPSGLTDTAALLGVLLPRRHVKALVFGHSHNWNVARQEDLHLINLPPVAYVFSAEKPSGWVDALIGPSGMTLQLQSLDPAHPQHAQQIELAWRF